MELAEIELLPAAQRLALAYLGEAEQTKLEPAFALDFRLARIVGAATEPMLGQMRIAWWRDMLSKPVGERPQGDAVLNKISEYWNEDEAALIDLANAWEELLLAEQLDSDTAIRIAKGRGAFVTQTIQTAGYSQKTSAEVLAMRWALADLAAHCSLEEERNLLVGIADRYTPKREPLPRNLRGFAVLNALSLHALKRGGRPLAEGRMGALIALRAGLLGR
jgi:phytoene synthase